jgi:hypothetical protein
LHYFLPWRWKQLVRPKRLKTSSEPHDIISEKPIIFRVTAVRIWNLAEYMRTVLSLCVWCVCSVTRAPGSVVRCTQAQW